MIILTMVECLNACFVLQNFCDFEIRKSVHNVVIGLSFICSQTVGVSLFYEFQTKHEHKKTQNINFASAKS